MDDWMARTPDWMEGMTDLQRDTVARLESREKSCQMRFESLRLDEIDWKAERKKLLAERDALIKQRDEATAWIPCADRLPTPGQPVLVAVGSTVLRAMHAPHLTLSEDDYGDFQPLGEYDEKTDRTYWPEGWYECNVFEETHWRVERDPTHWMPMPKTPREKEGGGA